MRGSKRLLRDLVVEASGATSKQDFNRFVLDLFADDLSETLRSQLHNGYHHLTVGKFIKSSSRQAKPKPADPAPPRGLKPEREYAAYEGRARH